MLAIITFVSTLVIGLVPNTDTYERTVNEVYADGSSSTRVELISEWNFDQEKGWMYEMPEIEIVPGIETLASDNDSENWITELPEITVTL